jgi:hypothetical protein
MNCCYCRNCSPHNTTSYLHSLAVSSSGTRPPKRVQPGAYDDDTFEDITDDAKSSHSLDVRGGQHSAALAKAVRTNPTVTTQQSHILAKRAAHVVRAVDEDSEILSLKQKIAEMTLRLEQQREEADAMRQLSKEKTTARLKQEYEKLQRKYLVSTHVFKNLRVGML